MSIPLGGAYLPGPLPVNEDADVLAVAPAFVKSTDAAPVRDAIIAFLRVMFTTYQNLGAYCAAQTDILTATGPYLDEKLEYERGVSRLSGELDEAYRLRGLGLQAVASPVAIIAAVNAIIAPLTCTFMEPAVDRLFVSDGTNLFWHSYIGAPPTYPDRFYSYDSVVNSGVIRPNLHPNNGLIFSDCNGRYFVLTLPNISALDTSIDYSGNGLALSGDPSHIEIYGYGVFLMDGTAGTDRMLYGYGNTTSTKQTYDLIVSTVERLRGTSFRWALISQA